MSYTILIIEDSPTNMKLVTTVLAKEMLINCQTPLQSPFERQAKVHQLKPDSVPILFCHLSNPSVRIGKIRTELSLKKPTFFATYRCSPGPSACSPETYSWPIHDNGFSRNQTVV